jgi:signal transduction histidine kinase
LVARLLTGLRDACVRAPAKAVRGWPARRRWRVLLVAFWAALATGLTVGAVAQTHLMGVALGLAFALGLAQAGPLLVASRWPLAAWRTIAIGMLAGVLAVGGRHHLWPWAVTAWLALAFVLLQVGICSERWTAIGAGVATVLGVVLPAVVFGGTPFWLGVILTGILAAVTLLGDLVRGRNVAEASLAAQAELRRRDLARQAVLEERTRIARELHDVVAHHMSVIVLQAGAAPYKIADLPPAARRTFDVIGDSARAALAETRRVVGLLREDDEAVDRVPQPGLDRFDELIEAARRAGLAVTGQILGVPRPIAAGVDLSAYRIVQEALSNAVRYAPGSAVDVGIRYGDDRLALSIVDDGNAGTVPPAAGGGHGGGHGLVGMRERVTMLGGTLRTGHRTAGGFEVAAELPYGAE